MRLSTNIILLSLSFLTFATPGQALGQGIIINELFNSSSNDEWVELLVVQDSLDIRGWNLRDFTGSGNPQPPLAFTSNVLWGNLRAGTIIVVARPENTSLVEDLDPSDFLLIVKSNNSLYFGGNPFLFAGPSDAFQIRTGSNVHVFGVSWGAVNSGSLPGPKVHFTSGISSGNTIFFNEDSLPELTSITNWTFNTPTQTLGTGNTPTNSSWITSLRGQPPAFGTGSATVEPTVVYSNQTIPSLIFTILQDSSSTLAYVSILVPTEWLWSHLAEDIEVSGPGFQSASVAVNGDTIVITQAAITPADSGIARINELTSPSTKGGSVFVVRTATQSGSPALIQQQPRVRVLELVSSVLVHVNDSQGVPAPPYQVGAEVTVTGIVTASLSPIRTEVYVQDETASINIFSFDTLSMPLNRGDSITVTGTILQFRGLTEISPEIALLERHASGRPVPDPMVLTCQDVNNTFQPDYSEPNESRLIRINGVTYDQVNSTISDATGATGIFIPNTFPPTPSMFDVIGILKQFKPGTPAPGPPYTDDYEIVPRDPDDIIAHPGPIITSMLFEDNIQPNSVRLQWTTNVISSSIVRYGTTPAYTDSLIDTSGTINHAITLTSLTPATVYYYSVGSGDSNGTNFSPTFLFSTASPPSATGEINVYFNRSVNTSVSTGEIALGNQDLVSRLVTRINNARRSIDAMIHSLSSSPGDAVAFALVNAKNRGVKVRVIAEYDNRITNAFNIIVAGGIPFITDRFDAINDGAGLMHNKAFVFDYRGGAPESVWVWTGSWNLTAQQTTTDHQNSIEVQDVALAGAYTLEFNEMWGSDTDIPNAGISRFGVRKRDNTPHRFFIDGLPVSCYFSPSDRSTTHIINTLAQAESDIAFALFAFTRRDIADALIDRKNSGKTIRGVMERDVPPEQFTYLFSNGIDVHLDPFASLLHHKYAIVDGTKGTLGPQWVITGSQNWSFSGENRNNENTLIIQSRRIANLYLQEFAARYYEAGGMDSIFVSVELLDPRVPASFSLLQNYPNPFNPSTKIQYLLPGNHLVTLKVYDLLGREVTSLVNEKQAAGSYRVEFSTNGLASGVYFYRLRAGSFVETKKMLLMR
ncbi:MAG: phospholipase D-like domain-containing protein [Ignavibacteria bacterium]|nr:phospholipase D-like domain-containing protein [Ignavibacteria bacterium]